MDLLQFTKDNPPPVGTLDKGETPFDPGKHSSRVNPKTLRWMPRSPGRYNKGQSRLPGVDAATQPAATADAPASTPSGIPPVKEVTADVLLELPKTQPAPKSEAQPGDTAPTPPPSPTPPASAPLPEVGPQTEQKGAETSAPSSPRGSDASMAHEAAAELSARVVYTLTGVFIGDHKRATASGDEHKNIRAAFAAFYQYRGVVFVGGVAIALVLLAYVLGDARREEVVSTVKRVFAKKPKGSPSGPIVDVETTTPAPAAPAPAPAPADFAAFDPR